MVVKFKMPFYKCLLLAIVHYIYADNEYTIEHFNQSIDHFNFYSYGNKTFKQRFLYNDKNFNLNNGTLLFYAGNEGDITAFWNNTGFIFDVSYLYRGLVVFAEHRFYGDSLPFEKDNFKQPHLSLLTIDQALADFAYIIRHVTIKFKLKINIPVFTFGGSYGGILSAFMRIKYPHIVDGAIASSAPLLGIANVIPRDYFFSKITQVFEDTNKDCVNLIKKGFDAIENMLCHSGKDDLDIAKELNLCSKPTCAADRAQLFSWMRNAFTLLAMCNYPYATNFLANLPGHPVKESCDMLKKSPSPIKGLHSIMDLVYNSTKDPGKRCFDIYKEYVICADPTGCGHGTDGIAWDYQSCTDMILPEGTNHRTDMFPELPFSLEDRKNYCAKTYDVIPRNERIALIYGDNLYQKLADQGALSNIVFTNGDLDPWTPGGILKNLSKSVVSYLVEGGAHHLDLRASNPLDPPSVKRVREAVIYHIATWINSTAAKNIDNHSVFSLSSPAPDDVEILNSVEKGLLAK